MKIFQAVILVIALTQMVNWFLLIFLMIKFFCANLPQKQSKLKISSLILWLNSIRQCADRHQKRNSHCKSWHCSSRSPKLAINSVSIGLKTANVSMKSLVTVMLKTLGSVSNPKSTTSSQFNGKRVPQSKTLLNVKSELVSSLSNRHISASKTNKYFYFFGFPPWKKGSKTDKFLKTKPPNRVFVWFNRQFVLFLICF